MGHFIVLTGNENVTPLVEFPLFRTMCTNHNTLVYPFENITHDALDSKMVNR